MKKYEQMLKDLIDTYGEENVSVGDCYYDETDTAGKFIEAGASSWFFDLNDDFLYVLD